MEIPVRIWVEVEGGARFLLGECDKAIVRMIEGVIADDAALRMLALQEEGRSQEEIIGALAAEGFESMDGDRFGLDLFCAWFLGAVRGWENVTCEGQPVPFSLEMARDIPTEVKLEVWKLAQERKRELSGKGARPSGPPTNSSPPAPAETDG
jgi:hypothetical protein